MVCVCACVYVCVCEELEAQRTAHTACVGICKAFSIFVLQGM